MLVILRGGLGLGMTPFHAMQLHLAMIVEIIFAADGTAQVGMISALHFSQTGRACALSN